MSSPQSNGSTPEFVANWNKVTPSFEEMLLKTDVMRGIQAMGFKQPTAIQQRAVPPIIKGHDVILQSEWSSGKTTAVCIGVLNCVDPTLPHVQTIIIAPSRVLAQETVVQLATLNVNGRLSIRAFIGGTDSKRDTAALTREGIQIVVGTPGRIKQLIDRRTLLVDHLRMFVIDEADVTLTSCGFGRAPHRIWQYLGESFKEQLLGIVQSIHRRSRYRQLARRLQMIVSSPTMSDETWAAALQFTNGALHILAKNETSPLIGLRQFYINVEKEDLKYETLDDLLATIDDQCVVYCNNSDNVMEVHAFLRYMKLKAGCVHGKLEQATRNAVLQDFSDGKTRILVASDHFKGLSVPLVFNFDLPSIREIYVRRARPVQHPVGRRGKGVIVNFVTATELDTLEEIEKVHSTKIEEFPADFDAILAGRVDMG